jgi:hypothetical protein
LFSASVAVIALMRWAALDVTETRVAVASIVMLGFSESDIKTADGRYRARRVDWANARH